MRSPVLIPGAGIGNENVLTAGQQEILKKLIEEYNGPGKKAYGSAQTLQGSLYTLDTGVDNLISESKGNFNTNLLVPGAGAEVRANFARLINTMYQMAGKTPPIDPTKVATMEMLIKTTKTTGMEALNHLFGGQREALQTIQTAISTIPGIENTYLGAKLIIEGLKMGAQRVIDQREFEYLWLSNPANQGNLIGAAEKFNELYPAQMYAQHALEKFGLTPAGFRSPDDIGEAYRRGWITEQQGEDILHKQFPNRFAQPKR
jgi:hypothetical protein